jgi:hypothetical protein
MGFLKKITRPISKALDKIVPNEVKPFLPYLAAVAPYMLPPGAGGIFGSIGIQNPMLQRALLSGGLNLGSQLAQEGSEGDFSGISALLAAGQGALTAPGASQSLEALRPTVGAEGQLTGLQSLGSKSISLLQRGSEGLQNIMEAGKADPFSMAGLKAASIPITQGTTDLAMSTARRALKDYEDELAAFNEQADATTAASDLARRNAIISSMTAAAFDEDTIDDTLSQLGLKNGGRVGFAQGGNKKTMIVDLLNKGADLDLIKATTDASDEEIMEAVDFFKYGGAGVPLPTFNESGKMIDDGLYKGRETRPEAKAYGGIMTAKRGLVNAPGGYAGEEEMDRGGGISIGIGKLYPKMLKQRAGEVVDFLSPSNIKDMPKDFSNFLKKSFNDPEGPYQKIKQDMIKSKDKKSSSDEGFGGIEKAVESVEEKPKTFLVDKLKVTVNPGESQEKATLNAIFNDVDDVMPQDRKEEFYRLLIPKLKNTGEISDNEYKMLMQEVFSKAKGGIISLNMGGSVLPKGIEMDLRGGGFIPMGSMEKADDVPARVSKNEFVMTADAVKAAGGGSINKGAQRMYQLMNNLEARV